MMGRCASRQNSGRKKCPNIQCKSNLPLPLLKLSFCFRSAWRETVAPILSENSTLALLLGASEYPDADDLSNPAFERSARAFRSYLLNSLKLNERNIFYHFNEDDWP